MNLYLGLAGVVARTDLSLGDSLACQLLVLRFCAAELRKRAIEWIRETRRSLGITQDLFRRASRGPRPR